MSYVNDKSFPMEVILVIALLVKLTNIFLHGIGFYLLKRVQRTGLRNVQMIYITSLSVVELIMNIMSFIRNLLRLMPFKVFKSCEFKSIVMYSYIFDYTILKFCLYMTMIIITLDRVVLILLNATYPNHWNVKKARYLVRCIWLFGAFVFIVTTSVYINSLTIVPSNTSTELPSNVNLTYYNSTATDHDYHRATRCDDNNILFLIANYVTLIFDIIFVTIAVGSYALIFHVFKTGQRKVKLRRSGSKTGLWRTFRQSRFYVSLLLILAFVFFVIPADLAWIVFSSKTQNEVVALITTTSYAISYFSDGLIYIFMNPKVKGLFLRHLRSITRLGINGEDRITINQMNLIVCH